MQVWLFYRCLICTYTITTQLFLSLYWYMNNKKNNKTISMRGWKMCNTLLYNILVCFVYSKRQSFGTHDIDISFKVIMCCDILSNEWCTPCCLNVVIAYIANIVKASLKLHKNDVKAFNALQALRFYNLMLLNIKHV